MKKLIPLIIISIICTRCENFWDNTNFTHRHKFENADSINVVNFQLSPTQPTYIETEDSFKLDIDHDSKKDITFYVCDYSLGHESKEYSRIKVENDYEVAVGETYSYHAGDRTSNGGYMVYDSTLIDIPKFLRISDTISMQLTYKSGSFNLAYVDTYTYDFYSTHYINGASTTGASYIALRNKTDNILCWIKIIPSRRSINIQSYYYTIDNTLLVIEE